MYIQSGTLEAIGKTKEEVAELVREALLSEESGGGLELRTHRTCADSLGRLEAVRNLWPKIEAGTVELNNLLADEELRDKVEEWFWNEKIAPETILSCEEAMGEDVAADLKRFAEHDAEALARVLDVLEQLDFDVDDETLAEEDDPLVRALGATSFFREFDIDEIREQVEADFYEALAYWTVYFGSGGDVDTEAAHKAHLVAFEVEDRDGQDDGQYLALGACGMDLSPRTDAYNALAFGVIPEGSQFFRQPDYFKHVVGGEAAMAEVDAATRLEVPQLILSVPLTNGLPSA